MKQFTFPESVTIDFRERPQALPFILCATFTYDGPMTSFGPGQEQSPEPMVSIAVNKVLPDDVESHPFITIKTSAVPLMDEPTEECLLRTLAFHSLFDTMAQAKTEYDELTRLEAMSLVANYQNQQIFPGYGAFGGRNSISDGDHLANIAGIKKRTYYYCNAFEYQGYSVWLKRQLIDDARTGGLQVMSRWTFVRINHPCAIRGPITIEDKKVFVYSNPPSSPYVSFYEVCLAFDELKGK